MENVHEELEKYECNKCGKCFTQNIGLKTHITAVHEKKSIVIYVAKILLEDVISKYTYKLFKDFEFKCDQCDKNFTKAFNVMK